jgi:hypothetical protein
MPGNVSRRSFLKAGLIGTLALAAAGGIYRALHGAAPPGGFELNPSTAAVLAGIIPAMLKDAIDPVSADLERAIAGVGKAIAGLPLSTQKEIQDLFALLASAPSRRLLTGLADDWPKAKPDDVSAFLQGWHTSRFELLQSAYHGLHDLILGSWYADESTWEAIGYPGPVKELL